MHLKRATYNRTGHASPTLNSRHENDAAEVDLAPNKLMGLP